MKEIKVYELLPALHRTADVTGATVDLQETINPKGREMKAYLNVGAVTSSASPEDATLDVKLQESANDSDWTDISGATFTQVTSAGGVTAEEIHFIQTERYLRADSTQVGTTDTFDYCVIAHAVLRLSAL